MTTPEIHSQFNSELTKLLQNPGAACGLALDVIRNVDEEQELALWRRRLQDLHPLHRARLIAQLTHDHLQGSYETGNFSYVRVSAPSS